MASSTGSLMTLIGASLMLLALIGAIITLLALRRRKKSLIAALRAEYGDRCGSLRR